MAKNTFDFDFHSDKTNRFIPIIISFLMYSATIAIVSCLFTFELTSNWKNALNGRLTIEFTTNIGGITDNLTEKQNEETINIIKLTPGIKSVKKLDESNILKILEPWMNSIAIPDDFPFPTILDVETEQDAQIDLLALSEKLSKICPGTRIHDHANWYAPIMKISNGLFAFAILLCIFIFITVFSTVFFITKKALNIHQNIVKILQLIGANNKYIASQFKQYYFSIGRTASFISIILSALTIFFVVHMFSTDILVIENIKYLGITIIVPLFVTILVMLTANSSVMFFLKKDSWIK